MLKQMVDLHAVGDAVRQMRACARVYACALKSSATASPTSDGTPICLEQCPQHMCVHMSPSDVMFCAKDCLARQGARRPGSASTGLGMPINVALSMQPAECGPWLHGHQRGLQQAHKWLAVH